MLTRKIKGVDEKNKCNHPEHNPPKFRIYEEGTYEHECPSCGNKQVFTVNKAHL